MVKEGSRPTIHYLRSFTNIPVVKIEGIFLKISKVGGVVLSPSLSLSVCNDARSVIHCATNELQL